MSLFCHVLRFASGPCFVCKGFNEYSFTAGLWRTRQEKLHVLHCIILYPYLAMSWRRPKVVYIGISHDILLTWNFPAWQTRVIWSDLHLMDHCSRVAKQTKIKRPDFPVRGKVTSISLLGGKHNWTWVVKAYQKTTWKFARELSFYSAKTLTSGLSRSDWVPKRVVAQAFKVKKTWK